MTVKSSLKLVSLYQEHQSNFYTAGDQLLPDILTLKTGAEIVAYTNANGTVLIENSASNGLGAYQIPYVGATSAVGAPALAELANGNFLVVWDDDIAGNAGIKAAIYQPNAVPVQVGINLTAGDDASYSNVDVAALSNGKFVVSYLHDGRVHAQLYNSLGASAGGEKNVSASTGGTASDTQVTALKDGGFVITWTDHVSGTDAIHAKIYNADGSKRTGDVTLADSGAASDASVVALDGGKFAVAYVDRGWAEGGTLGNGISLEIFDANTGLTSSGYIHVNNASLGDEVDPDITVLENGYIVVSWTKPFSATDHDIIGRVFDPAGNAVTIDGKSTEFVITNSNNMDVKSAIAATFGGTFTTVWQDAETDGNGGQIRSVTKDIVRVTIGDAAADSFTGDSLSDSINGGNGSDTLVGGGGNDTIEGALDGDEIYGGSGDDYLYANTKAAPDGSVIGDTLSGGSGNDWLYGSKGNDSISGGSGTDLIRSSGGSDTVNGGDDYDFIYAGDSINGTGMGDSISGGDGADHIYGSAGVDTMNGGEGDDAFGIWFLGQESKGDIFSGGAGYDKIEAMYSGDLSHAKLSSIEAVRFHYGSNITLKFAASQIGNGLAETATIINEAFSGSTLRINMLVDNNLDLSKLVFTYSLDSNYKFAAVTVKGDGDAEKITGSTVADLIQSGGGNDTLVGGGDTDRLYGGAGDDLYRVDHSGEAHEKAGEGTDTVRSNVNYTLGANIENLVLVGHDKLKGTGNELANEITGNDANNTLNGKAGNDILTGGLGDDRFLFNATLDATKNVDTIVDFSVGHDEIRLDHAIFAALAEGDLDGDFFRAAPAAVDDDDHLIYNKATGALPYDADGNGGGGQIVFAMVGPGLDLTAQDLFVY